MKPYEEELYAEHATFRVQKQLQLYVLPLIVVVGVVGNTLSVLILTRPSFRRVATYTYLTAVAIADTLVLIAAPFSQWLSELTDVDPREYANWSCKTIVLFTFTVSDFSVWLLVAVTVERYLAVSRPLRVPTQCTRQRTVIVILGLFALALAVNVHFAWTIHVQSHELMTNNGSNVTIPKCEARQEHVHLVKTVWPCLDFICYFCFPFVAIAVLNSLIIHQVVKARRRRGSMSGSSGTSICGGGGQKLRSTGTPFCSPDEIGANTKLAIMLMTVSFTFLLLALPLNSLIIIMAVLNTDPDDLPKVLAFDLARTVLQLLMYTNHAVNFYLYCATGQKFRRQLYSVVCSGCVPGGGLSGTGGVSPRNDIHGREKGFSLCRAEGSERVAMLSPTNRNVSSAYRTHQPSGLCENMVAETAL